MNIQFSLIVSEIFLFEDQSVFWPDQQIKRPERAVFCLDAVIKIVLISLLLTLNRLHTFFWCLNCLLTLNKQMPSGWFATLIYKFFVSLSYPKIILRLRFTANINLFKVNNRRTRKRCEICSRLTIKTPRVNDINKNELPNYIFTSSFVIVWGWLLFFKMSIY